MMARTSPVVFRQPLVLSFSLLTRHVATPFHARTLAHTLAHTNTILRLSSLCFTHIHTHASAHAHSLGGLRCVGYLNTRTHTRHPTQTDEDKKRLSGPGMIVADKAPATWQEAGLDENAWYLAQPEGARAIQLVDGRRAKAQELDKRGALCGVVLFLARPPVKETEDRGHNLLQV